MKAVLTYELPEEAAEFRNATNGWRWRRVVEALDEELRNRIKYQDLPEPLSDELQSLRDLLHSTITDYNLTLDEE